MSENKMNCFASGIKDIKKAECCASNALNIESDLISMKEYDKDLLLSKCEKEVHEVLDSYLDSERSRHYDYQIRCIPTPNSEQISTHKSNVSCSFTVKRNGIFIYGNTLNVNDLSLIPTILNPDLDGTYINNVIFLNGFIQRIYEVISKYHIEYFKTSRTDTVLSLDNIQELLKFPDGVYICEAVKQLVRKLLTRHMYDNISFSSHIDEYGFIYFKLYRGTEVVFSYKLSLVTSYCGKEFASEMDNNHFLYIASVVRMLLINFKFTFDKNYYSDIKGLFKAKR